MRIRYWKQQLVATIAVIGLVAVLWGITTVVLSLLSMVMGIK